MSKREKEKENAKVQGASQGKRTMKANRASKAGFLSVLLLAGPIGVALAQDMVFGAPYELLRLFSGYLKEKAVAAAGFPESTRQSPGNIFYRDSNPEVEYRRPNVSKTPGRSTLALSGSGGRRDRQGFSGINGDPVSG
ncbi:MAG: hypothetical protein HYY21_09230 [Candidatus Tectomicrobia bacterium]|nr:hypothetical protein [Candidatus Tectomicrobia bacterium]